MLVSVIIRNRNYGRFLRQCLESCTTQVMDDNHYDVIVIDGGSSDQSAEIYKEFSQEIQLVERPDLGAVAALNEAIRLCTGRYFTIVDADDWAESTLLASLVGPLESNASLGFSYCDYWEEASDAPPVYYSLAQTPFDGLAAGVMHRRDLVLSLGLYDTSLLLPEYDLLSRLLERTSGAHVSEALYHYRRHGKNLTSDKTRVLKEIELLRQRWGPGFRCRAYP